MIIPTEARATISAYREGKTEAQFIAYMWTRRRTENPGRVKSTGIWPIRREVAKVKPSNVTAIRKRT